MGMKIITAFIFIEIISNMGSFSLPDCGVRTDNQLPGENVAANGRDVSIGEHPWAVAIYVATDADCEKFKQVCGGTIINEKWVATAGHCVCPFNPAAYRIYAGTNDISETTASSAEIYNVSEIFMHPDFEYYSLVNDIALLRTSDPIEISTGEIYINRICLPTEDEKFENELVVVGWKQNSSKDESDKQLKEVPATVINNSVCNKEYDSNPNDNTDFIDEKVICASRQKRRDCFANAGGPLMKKDDQGVYKLIGIFSYGYNCVKEPHHRPPYILPGVYTNVLKYVTWIEEILAKPENATSEFPYSIYYCVEIDKRKCSNSSEEEEEEKGEEEKEEEEKEEEE